MQQAGQNTGGPVCVSDPEARNHVTADGVLADSPSPSRQLWGFSLWLRTTNTETERLGGVSSELIFSLIFHFSAPKHSFFLRFFHVFSLAPLQATLPFSALNCRTPPPFSITISAFTRQPCRTHPASTHFEWRTLQHPEERGRGWMLNKDKDAFRYYFSCRNCNFRNWRETHDLWGMKRNHSHRTEW